MLQYSVQDIVKIFTIRLQKIIGETVDCAQSGCIPKGHIGDNILLATELIKGYTRKYVSPRLIIKVSLKKPMILLNGLFSKLF